MVPARSLLFIALAGLIPARALSQHEFLTAPVPSDPLELATRSIQVVDTQEGRAALLKILAHARDNYRFKDLGLGYMLKVSFTVDSAGQTQYDGAWEMEDAFAPGLGVRWTATAAAGYATTRIDSGRLHYAEGTEGDIPLVLHEARGALEGSMPSPDSVDRQTIRTFSATFNGVQLTCVLFSDSGLASAPEAGRGWEETEECVDSHSGLLRIHSLVPGRYALFDYTDAVDFHTHVLPRKVTITEGGKPTIELRLDSLEDLPTPDAALYVPTEQMRANGPAVVLAGMIKIPRLRRPGAAPPGSMLQPVVVFGLLTPSGQIVDAHSLQPSNIRSDEAVASAAAIKFPDRTPPGKAPQQHEVFVIE
jgi:hypothetical protein